MTRWGTVGFFEFLSVRPELCDQGVASRLMMATVALFDRWGISRSQEETKDPIQGERS